MMKTNAGFTLIELMMTIAIAAIVLTLGIPSFQETMRNNRLTTQANDLLTAMNLARSEAIKRRSTVSVCASTNQTSCTASAWHQGWIVRDDTNNALIRAYPPMKGSTTVSSAGDIVLVRYSQAGFLEDANPATLTLCAQEDHPGRRIAVGVTGRPASIKPHPDC